MKRGQHCETNDLARASGSEKYSDASKDGRIIIVRFFRVLSETKAQKRLIFIGEPSFYKRRMGSVAGDIGSYLFSRTDLSSRSVFIENDTVSGKSFFGMRNGIVSVWMRI